MEVRLPTLVEIGNLQIRLYPRDHLPPHFHISTPYGEAMMLIADQSLYHGRLRKRDLQIARDWARANKEFLENEWAKFNG